MVRLSSVTLLTTLAIQAESFVSNQQGTATGSASRVNKLVSSQFSSASVSAPCSSSALALGYEYPVREDQRTLYEILESPSDATRSELKKSYITLVRKSHPDALINKKNSQDNGDGSTTDDDTGTDENNIDEFQEITQAWKTLSNPLERKRYDRTLRAQEFTKNVEDAMDNFGKTAGPPIMKAFENIAIPFLRRSTATTVAGFTAVSNDVNKTNGDGSQASGGAGGLGEVLSNAVRATQEAGKAIDRLEIMEKGQELHRRAQHETIEAMKLQDEIDRVMRKRVNLMIHTPNARLTSLEAKMIFDGFNVSDEVSMLDSMRLRHSVSYEIEQLEKIELNYNDKLETRKSLQFDIERKALALDKARFNAAAAEQAEYRARRALEDAKSLVESTREDVDNAIDNLSVFAEEEIENGYDIEKTSSIMLKQQEKVRITLRRKEQAVYDAMDGSIDSSMTTGGDFDRQTADDVAEEIENLLEEERYMREQIAKMEATAERLESRSKKLKLRSDSLEEQEEEAYKVLEEGLLIAAESGYDEYRENTVGNP